MEITVHAEWSNVVHGPRLCWVWTERVALPQGGHGYLEIAQPIEEVENVQATGPEWVDLSEVRSPTVADPATLL
jgi:hypothetical protein